VRWATVLAWTLVGVALAGGVQWAADGAPGVAARLPAWAPQILPLAAFVVFGAFVVGVYGAAPGALQGLVGALAALLLAGLPLAYAFGLAERYGLPGHAGMIGSLLSGPEARAAAALWLPAAFAAALRRPRATAARLRPPAPAPDFAPAGARSDGPSAPAPFWTPALPEPSGTEAAPVAYTPGDGGRG